MSALSKLWGMADVVSSRVFENNKIQFLFQSEESLLSVLHRGPWSFNEWMVSLHRWSPNHTDADFNFISFWVQVRGIPIQYLTQRVVVRIGHEIGQFGYQTAVLNFSYEKLRGFCGICGMMSHDTLECRQNPIQGNMDNPNDDDDNGDDDDDLPPGFASPDHQQNEGGTR
ncbi:hypothetical protein Bca101_059194 [Brassica carinata]